MKRLLEETKNEIVRLRVEERMSHKEIASLVGASLGTVSVLLRGHPLSVEERRRKMSEAAAGNKAASYRNDNLVSILSSGSTRFEGFVGAGHCTSRVGGAAEIAVALRLVANGFAVYRPMMDGSRQDIIAEDEKTGRLIRVQVKATQRKRFGLPSIRVKRAMGRRRLIRYEEGEFDFIVGFDLLSDSAFVFSSSEVANNVAAVSVTIESFEAWWKLR